MLGRLEDLLRLELTHSQPFSNDSSVSSIEGFPRLRDDNRLGLLYHLRVRQPSLYLFPTTRFSLGPDFNEKLRIAGRSGEKGASTTTVTPTVSQSAELLTSEVSFSSIL
ncbi:unnamed protein product, partial [Protopolystoma xenopodis]